MSIQEYDCYTYKHAGPHETTMPSLWQVTCGISGMVDGPRSNHKWRCLPSVRKWCRHSTVCTLSYHLYSTLARVSKYDWYRIEGVFESCNGGDFRGEVFFSDGYHVF